MTTPLEDIDITTIDGDKASLGDWTGKVRLVVNTASKCGLTPQYEGLEALYRAFSEDDFVILGFPSNDFAGQEPLAEDDIKQFCTATYNITFPMFSKIKVTGQDKHPLYAALTTQKPDVDAPDTAMRSSLKKYGLTPAELPEVLWNFSKFLISRDGKVIGRFPPDMDPSDPILMQAIKDAL